MSLDISLKNESRLIASAEAEGVSVDAYVERLINEQEEVASTIERSDARRTPLTDEEARAKIDRGYLQSERGEVADGEAFCAGVLAELDDIEHRRRAR
ncbi:MAG TPA: hypothetical protein VE959_12570 [Bryobacteraceae bacterium]|nr:hypothetical protein [Bryobacteraceae bacterium]